jgi:extradiol dioxygenase family protein
MEAAMLGMSEVFASFSVDDIGAAKRFYGDTLGLDVAGGVDDRGPYGFRWPGSGVS